MRMQQINSGVKRILFFLLFLFSFYWFFWSVRYIFSDVLPTISHTFFLSLLVLGIVTGITFYKTLKNPVIKSFNFLYTYRYFVIGILFIGQVVVSVFAQGIPNGDASILYKVATAPPTHEGLSIKYFSLFPNNFLIFIVFKILNGLVTAQQLILTVSILNALLIDSGILLLTGLAEHLKGKKLGQIVFLESIFLFGLQPHFLSFYSDPATFFLMSLLCYLTIINSGKAGFFRWFAMGLLFSIAFKIRVPIFIYLIALVIIIIYRLIFQRKQVHLKRLFMQSLFVVLGTLTMTFAINYYAENQKFVEYNDKYNMSPWFFVDLGLTATGADHAAISQDVKLLNSKGEFKLKSELEPQLKEDAIKRLSHYGFWGLIKHQSTKFKIFTQDGSLGWTAENVLKEQKVVKTKFTNSKFGHRIRSVLYVGSPYYANYSLYLQIVWVIVILGLVFYFKRFKQTSNFEFYLQIVLFGVILYLSIFEAGRSRYLIQFLPAIIMLSSIGYFNYFDNPSNKIVKKALY